MQESGRERIFWVFLKRYSGSISNKFFFNFSYNANFLKKLNKKRTWENY